MNAALHPTIALLQSSSLTTVVQQEIERAILVGDYAPGSKLNEAALAEKLEAAAAELKDEAEKVSGKLYAAYAAKAAAKAAGGNEGSSSSSSYFAKEHARLERMLGSGSVGGGKAAEISRKLSVLSAFLPEEEGEGAAAATA